MFFRGFLWLFLACLALAPAACFEAPPAVEPTADPEPSFGNIPADSFGGDAPSATPFSHIGEPIINVLSGLYPGSQGEAWQFSTDSAVEADWLLDTPRIWYQPASELNVAGECEGDEPGCELDFGLWECQTQADCELGGTCQVVRATVRTPGENPVSLCVGHSAHLWEAQYEALVQAQSFVDVAVLEPPNGRFSAAIRNAITYLDRSGRSVEIRILFGHVPVPGHSTDTLEVLRDLTQYLPSDTHLQVSVGAYRSGVPSRNHTKIIAVDGHYLIQGGHNYWTETYLTSNPIFDVSMQIQGSPAIDAHMLLNRLWEYTCGPETLLGHNSLHSFPYEVALCPEPFVRPSTREAAGNIPVISVGRLSNLGENPADDALLTMLGAARETIRLSIQDIGPVRVGPITTTDWPEQVLAELGWALARGVDVYVVLSTPGAAPDGNREAGTYGNGWEPEDVAERVERWLDDNPYVFDDPGQSARELVCEHFHAATLRFSDDDTWEDGTSIGNHTKLIIVDDTAFYIGAQNLYPTDNAEFGLIIDDPVVTRDLLQRYWNPLWENSGRTAVSGREAPVCDY